MEEFKKLSIRQKVISFIVMFLITVATIAVFMSMTSAKRLDSDEIELDDGWRFKNSTLALKNSGLL